MEIKIYVANLGKYNEGILQGEWFTLPEEMETISKAIGLNAEYEECAIHDYEAPEGLKISEYSSIAKLNEIAERLDEMDEDEAKAALALLGNGNFVEFEDAADNVDNGRFYHDCENMSDVAYDSYTVNGDMEEDHPLFNYIDWERVGRDMDLNSCFLYLGENTWYEYFN